MPDIHTFIIVIVIVVIILVQCNYYKQCKDTISIFKKILPDKVESEWEIVKDSEGLQIVKPKYKKCKSTIDKLSKELTGYKRQRSENEFPNEALENKIRETEYALSLWKEELQELESSGKSTEPADVEPRKEIINSINDYLRSNRNSTSDFYLIKDIVDRNCDIQEEEIQSLTPIPLYLGLMGTMAGIIIGVGYLVFGVGIDELLKATNSGNGIKALLGGVALAMICSIVGLIMTVINSVSSKEAKTTCEKNKHNFLTWIQTQLLPVMTTDAASAMKKMTENLSDFNNTFSSNTQELKSTLSTVLTTSKAQAEVIEKLQRVDISRIAQANIEVYDKLRNCSDEIGSLGDYLAGCTSYLTQVNELNKKLNDADDRVRMIEEMATFFKDERANMEKMNKRIEGVIETVIGNSNMTLQKACKQLEDTTAEQIDALRTHSQNKINEYKNLIDAETEAVGKKIESISIVLTRKYTE